MRAQPVGAIGWGAEEPRMGAAEEEKEGLLLTGENECEMRVSWRLKVQRCVRVRYDIDRLIVVSMKTAVVCIVQRKCHICISCSLLLLPPAPSHSTTEKRSEIDDQQAPQSRLMRPTLSDADSNEGARIARNSWGSPSEGVWKLLSRAGFIRLLMDFPC